MKKPLAILLAALLAVSLLASCAASNSDAYGESGSLGLFESSGRKESTLNAVAPAEAPMYGMTAPSSSTYITKYDLEDGEIYGTESQEISAVISNPQRTAASMSEKIIYTITADIETIEFDDTVNKVYSMLDGFGAFVENSYVGGRNYWQTASGHQTYRNAWFTIRVPSEALSAMTDSLSGLGSVTSLQRSSDNVTSQYVDTESRLKSYRTQEERLFAMMEKAETVEDMLTIEGYLAEVRYQIEAMTSQLDNWQNRIDYSTVTLNINEVERLSELPPDLPQTYWQQVKSGFDRTLRGIGEFFTSLFKWLVVSSPVLVIIAVIIVVIVVISVKRRRAANRKAAVAPPEDRDA